ncbi:MAG: hypothetical protein DRH11_00345 [Deltaproteobacteria bacterium]|nr:MAG: hypothetical protein DRH11_00345 [Deltaproteobacteria bacterium]
MPFLSIRESYFVKRGKAKIYEGISRSGFTPAGFFRRKRVNWRGRCQDIDIRLASLLLPLEVD